MRWQSDEMNSWWNDKLTQNPNNSKTNRWDGKSMRWLVDKGPVI